MAEAKARSVRLPGDVWDAVDAAAEADFRSSANWVEAVIRRALSGEAPAAPLAEVPAQAPSPAAAVKPQPAPAAKPEPREVLKSAEAASAHLGFAPKPAATGFEPTYGYTRPAPGDRLKRPRAPR